MNVLWFFASFFLNIGFRINKLKNISQKALQGVQLKPAKNAKNDDSSESDSESDDSESDDSDSSNNESSGASESENKIRSMAASQNSKQAPTKIRTTGEVSKSGASIPNKSRSNSVRPSASTTATTTTASAPRSQQSGERRKYSAIPPSRSHATSSSRPAGQQFGQQRPVPQSTSRRSHSPSRHRQTK